MKSKASDNVCCRPKAAKPECCDAVYDQDETAEACCGCIDLGCPELGWENADMVMCGVCELDDEADSDEISTMFAFVCGIDATDDTAEFLMTE